MVQIPLHVLGNVGILIDARSVKLNSRFSRGRLLAFTYQCKTPLNARTTVAFRVRRHLGFVLMITLEIRLALALR